MSSLASNVPLPFFRISAIASPCSPPHSHCGPLVRISPVSGAIYQAYSFWGLTPQGLQCILICSATSEGPILAILLLDTSASKYLSTTSGCSAVETMFLLWEERLACSPWKPIRNPCSMPHWMYSANHLSGCSASKCCHATGLRGVRIIHASCGSLPPVSRGCGPLQPLQMCWKWHCFPNLPSPL